MKSFSERNLFVIGAMSIALIVVLMVAALQYDKLPFVNTEKQYEAYFTEAGGLKTGNPVEVSGYRVGQVQSITLDGSRVLVVFKVDKSVELGERTEAAINTKSVLGMKYLDLTPRGQGKLSAAIPQERTRSPYQLPDALGDLAVTISGLNTGQLSDSLDVVAKTFQDTPPELKAATEGVARFAQTIDERDEELRSLLANASKATGVLAQRSDDIVKLIGDTNALLSELRTQSQALDHISYNISRVSQQLSGFIADNHASLKPALDKLNGVLTIVDNRKDRVQQTIKLLNQYAMSLGESVASGPFFKAYVANLVPGQFAQPFIDAAFSDLGLDPHTLSPSQRNDPQTGQPGTPAMPVPYPRTGQGGDPKLTLPDAITGKPGDESCGPPGLPLPGPTGCYPYREPLPAPPPGGPPPGPPAPAPPGLGSTPQPAPTSIDLAPSAPPGPPATVNVDSPSEARP